ncbi:hypothetical protein Poly24_05230 [Rosistilla carotiformis]|uniref:Uncharacterized protein n=1 Tax=Rosistilla carotiformis TaxID=2528017 RepID=A0A518JMP8_9BACT|nr:hypothetical protein [Rosistilla carotiformis]QDV66835.1 hypothetical protein Poly24_05230 [Rosistilla carotiformis]
MISAQILSMDPAAEVPRSQSKLRDDASRPAPAAYGSRVQRRLRARWFELVPVRRRSLLAVKSFVLLAACLLIAGHYLSMNWAPLYQYPELARPLRLDNPASFGGWFGSISLALSAGIGFLIYQLRRHRADDYRGHYRIWRPVMALLVLLSVDSIAGTLDWCGAILDTLLAGRAPMAGGDWLRLLLCVAGFAMTARLLIEMRHSPAAAFWLVTGSAAVASRLPIRWNFIETGPLATAMIVGAGPLIGRIAVFLSLVTYLRSIYRDVRGLNQTDGQTGRLRLPRFGRKHLGREAFDEPDEAPKPSRSRKKAAAAAPEPEPEEQPPAKRGWFRRKPKPAADEVDEQFNDEQREVARKADDDEAPVKRKGWFSRKAKPVAEDGAGDSDDEQADDGEAPPKRKGWFGRKAKTAAEDGAGESDDEQADDDEAPPKRKGWFGRKAKPAATDEESSDDATDEAQEDVAPAKSKGWFSRKAKPAAEEDSNDDETYEDESEDDNWQHDDDEQDDHSESHHAAEDESVDVDNIDWSSMSKAERKRMKRLLRQQGKDAA